jgi:hypothetical protein
LTRVCSPEEDHLGGGHRARQFASGLDLYLQDLITLVKEKALDARAQRDATTGDDRLFATGRLMAFHEIVSLMQQQADAFGIGLDELGLEQIQPERDLAGPRPCRFGS